MLTQIFRNLQSAKHLQELHIGAKSKMSQHIIGLGHLLNDIGFDTNWIYLTQNSISGHLACNDIGAQYLDGHNSLLYRALIESNFKNQIVHTKIKNLYDAGGTWCLSQIWAAFDLPCFRELSVLDSAHVHTSHTTAASKVHVEELRLAGCKSSTECTVDIETFTLLCHTSFPQLTRIDLRDYSISDKELVAFLHHVEPNIQSVTLAHFHLSSGAWSSVFATLSGFSKLNRLNLKWLTEHRGATSTVLREENLDGRARTRCSVFARVKNSQQIQSSLMTLVTGYVHLPGSTYALYSNSKHVHFVAGHRHIVGYQLGGRPSVVNSEW